VTKQINLLRREAIEKLDRYEKQEILENDISYIKQEPKNSTPYFTARFKDVSTIPKNHPFKRIFIPLDSSDEDFKKYSAGFEFPRGIYKSLDILKYKLNHLKEIGVKDALCTSIDSYHLAKEMEFNTYCDFTLNIFNSVSANMFDSPILSVELTLKGANSINAKDTGIIGYGNIPIMLTRNCLLKIL